MEHFRITDAHNHNFEVRFEKTRPRGAERPKFTGEQVNLIQAAINNPAFKVTKNKSTHHIRVKVLSDDKFKVTLDNSSTFFISGKKVEALEVAQTAVVLEEKVSSKGLGSVIKSFFRQITNLFYKPSFPSTHLKDRKPSVALREDYRALTKAMEMGSRLYDTTPTDVQMAIDNSHKINKAVSSRKPSTALHRLAKNYTNQLLRDNTSSLTFATGYLNEKNVMQPLMVKISREGNSCHIELYCDNRDAGAKIAKTHTLELEDPIEEGLQKVLDLLLQPLAPKNVDEKALQKVTKHSETFSEMFTSTETRILAEMNLSPVDSSASSASLEAPSRPLHTLEGILRGIEANTGQVFSASGELETASKNPVDLVNRWISGKLDEGDRSPEKL
jgi:hypothetical protein